MEEQAAAGAQMGLGEKLTEAITPKTAFSFDLFGNRIPVSDSVVVMWIIMACIVVFAFVMTRGMKSVPGKRQNFIEGVVEFFEKWGNDNMGHHFMAFRTWLGTLFVFLIFANIVSIFNFVPFLPFPISPPTKNVNVTGAMAVMTIVIVVASGLKYKGPIGYLKSFVKPSPILLPFHILDYITRPLSLTLRLFGNILGAYLVMELLYTVFPIAIPGIFSIYFDLFDGAIQALVFTFLSLVYVREIIE